MAKFKVLRADTNKTYMEKKKRRNKAGDWVWFEQEVTEAINPGTYGHEDIKAGDVIEITDLRLIEKARSNPDFEEVKATAKKATAKKADGDAV